MILRSHRNITLFGLAPAEYVTGIYRNARFLFSGVTEISEDGEE